MFLLPSGLHVQHEAMHGPLQPGQQLQHSSFVEIFGFFGISSPLTEIDNF